MTDRELMQQALEALEHLNRTADTQVFDLCFAPVLIPALRERLARCDRCGKADPAEIHTCTPKEQDAWTPDDTAYRPGGLTMEQEPVAWMQNENFVDADNLWDVRVTFNQDGHGIPLYTAPQPVREWQGLTDEEVGTLTVFDGLHHVETPVLADFIRAIEAKLREKNA